MRTTTVLRLAVAALLWGDPAAQAETHAVTFDQAMALARERAPEAVAGRLRIAEAEAERVGAGHWLPANPEVAIAAGGRRATGGDSNELEVELSQRLEIGRQRGARLDRARAVVDQSKARADEAVRRAQLGAAAAFFDALHAAEVERLFVADAEAVARLVAVTGARAAKGESAPLDLQLARVAGARARAAAQAARSDRLAAEAALAAALGVPISDRVAPVGDLRPPTRSPAASAGTSPAIRAAAAEIEEGAAERRLGERSRWPDLALGASYAREEHDTIVLGHLTLGLPVVERGQELRAAGRARERRADAERTALATSVRRDVETDRRRIEMLQAAVDDLDREAVPALEEAERLLTRSFEQGVIDVRELLVTRRELVAARLEHAGRRKVLSMATAESLLRTEALR